ncbi:MAG TPA: histidine decarboxylase, pyruvoyl type [Chloroflexota bacterium]|nr:histidine decarboxylase, pyruvoyl type [Chloroflexota bacterium]
MRRIIGPLERHCASAGFGPEDAYLCAPMIGLGTAQLREDQDPGALLPRIVAFDRAEAQSANLTQTNLVQVSSFCGPRGLILGHDLLPGAPIPHPLLDPERFPGVFDISALLDTSRALLGTVREPRFPIFPGQYLLCAYKTLYCPGPCNLYGAMAVAIAKERDRSADLFLEDHGLFGEREDAQAHVLVSLIDAAATIGENLGVTYGRLYVGLRSRRVHSGEIGCSLTAAPYLRLARRAVPLRSPELLLELSVPQWEAAVSADFLSPAACPCPSPSSTQPACSPSQSSRSSF